MTDAPAIPRGFRAKLEWAIDHHPWIWLLVSVEQFVTGHFLSGVILLCVWIANLFVWEAWEGISRLLIVQRHNVAYAFVVIGAALLALGFALLIKAPTNDPARVPPPAGGGAASAASPQFFTEQRVIALQASNQPTAALIYRGKATSASQGMRVFVEWEAGQARVFIKELSSLVRDERVEISLISAVREGDRLRFQWGDKDRPYSGNDQDIFAQGWFKVIFIDRNGTEQAYAFLKSQRMVEGETQIPYWPAVQIEETDVREYMKHVQP